MKAEYIFFFIMGALSGIMFVLAIVALTGEYKP